MQSYIGFIERILKPRAYEHEKCMNEQDVSCAYHRISIHKDAYTSLAAPGPQPYGPNPESEPQDPKPAADKTSKPQIRSINLKPYALTPEPEALKTYRELGLCWGHLTAKLHHPH